MSDALRELQEEVKILRERVAVLESINRAYGHGVPTRSPWPLPTLPLWPRDDPAWAPPYRVTCEVKP